MQHWVEMGQKSLRHRPESVLQCKNLNETTIKISMINHNQVLQNLQKQETNFKQHQRFI